MRDAITPIFDAALRRRNVFLISMLLAALFVYPILLANVYFADDYSRHSGGFYSWSILGRPLGELLMRFITLFGSHINDIGQLGQLLCIPVFAATLYVIVTKFYSHTTLRHIVIWSPIILNPYLLANLSYRYDSLFMILGYCFAVIGASIAPVSSSGIIKSFLFLLASLFLYQPMAVVFLIVAILRYVAQFTNRHVVATSIAQLLCQFFCFIIALVSYYFSLSLLHLTQTPSAARGNIVSFSSEGIQTVLRHYKESLLYSGEFFHSHLTWFFVPATLLAMCGAVTVIYRILRQHKTTRITRWLKVIIFILSPLILAASLLGAQAILQTPIIEWRTMPTFGLMFIFILLLGGVVVESTKLWRKITIYLLALIPASILSFSFIYGAMLTSYSHYSESVTMQAVTLLTDKQMSSGIINMDGHVGVPASYNVTARNIPALTQQIPYGNDWIQRYIARELQLPVITNMSHSQAHWQSIVCTPKIKPDYQTTWFDVYNLSSVTKHEEVLVWFTNSSTDPLCHG